MVGLAMNARDEVRGTGSWTHARPWDNERLHALHKRITMWRVRHLALMARLFAGSIKKDDHRIAIINAEYEAHTRELAQIANR